MWIDTLGCRSYCIAMEYRYLTPKETEQTILRVLKTLSGDLPTAGPERRLVWEKGWAGNLKEYQVTGNLKSLIPKFVRNEIMRFPDGYIMPEVPHLETKLVIELRKSLFGEYFEDVNSVYEFGCGTGHNLVHLAQMYPDKKLYGLDWSETACQIIDHIAKLRKYQMASKLFDMFTPDYGLDVKPQSGMFTIGAMEQLGTTFEPFLQFVLDKKFSICINIETLYELYGPESLFDHVAIRYLEKRGYLKGYLTKLKELELEGKIKILKAHKGFGCLYHNGYSYVVWRPL